MRLEAEERERNRKLAEQKALKSKSDKEKHVRFIESDRGERLDQFLRIQLSNVKISFQNDWKLKVRL